MVRRNGMTWVFTLVVLGVALSSLAWQKPPSDEAVYLVTEWPAAADSRPYREFLQAYLNEMAGKGWRLDHDLVSATQARMHVFRKDRE